MKTPAFCLISAVSLILPTSLDARSWKEAGSDRSLEGEYSRTEGDLVVIVRPNGTSVKIPLAKLTDEDKEILADFTGYQEGGPAKYVEHLKGLLKSR